MGGELNGRRVGPGLVCREGGIQARLAAMWHSRCERRRWWWRRKEWMMIGIRVIMIVISMIMIGIRIIMKGIRIIMIGIRLVWHSRCERRKGRRRRKNAW